MAKSRRIQLHPRDNVTVCVEGPDGERGHKFATTAIQTGVPIVKLGEQIGIATHPIEPGDHVHSHNVAPAREPVSSATAATNLVPPPFAAEEATFDGFVRANGKVGTRNHLLVLTTVNCSASVARAIATHARRAGIDEAVDSVTALTHHGGCGIGVDSPGLANLRRTLAGYATHPNVAGTLIIGLGCEVNQIDALIQDQHLAHSDRVRTLIIQDEGGSTATIERGLELLKELATIASTDTRTAAPISELTIGLQCGGSDGYSAITANPALGRASDLLVGHGATVILGETPEMHGAEHLLVRRAISERVARKLLDRLDWWRDHSEPEDNPSPGNKRGGLTTIAEKSLGAIAKAGTTPLTDVLAYGEPAATPGFVIMDSPGYDPCSVTGEIASGATIICFTTGRGSVSGFAPAPSLKVSTNTALALRMAEDIDLDAGTIATGDESVDDVGQRLLRLFVATASGQPTASESLGFGEEEFVPWQMGVVT